MRKLKSGVESAEVGGRDGDEEDRDGGRLDQRVAIRPLHFLQLGPAGNQESDHAAALAFGLRLFLFLGELLALAALLLGALALLGFLLAPSLRRGVGRARLRRVGGLELRLRGAGGDPGLHRLDLGDVAGDGDLGVVLGARLGAALAVGAFPLLSFPSPALGLALCAGLGHRELPGLLVGRVVATPAAELAHLDPVRRVAPRLVGLVIPSLAVFASQRHRDADISASHASPSS